MKKWYESKTVWLAILQFVAGLIGLAIGVLQSEQEITAASVVVILKSLLDLVLRLKTDLGIAK